jgi:CRISPR-associated endonuclease/helicase Cas3
MVAYYAHTVQNSSEADWEPLRTHLKEVADLAAARAAAFGAPDFGRIAGLLHDLGKYSDAFQGRLHGKPGSVDHSTAGAVWAKAHLPPKWGRLIAHAVAGHHAGLQDKLFDIGGRLDEKSADEVARRAWADGLVLLQDLAKPGGMLVAKDRSGFQRAFLTRMIFSCLIDADRTAAAAFDARMMGKVEEFSPDPPSIAALDDELRTATAGRPAAESKLNALRDKVLQAALMKAIEPPGSFTLTVPTGGGKTLTSLAFALAHARAHDLERVIVVIPYTSIIEQTASVYRSILGTLGEHAVLEHHSTFAIEDEAVWSRDRVGPERLRLSMERWDKPIVVTTAVQFFESLFSDRPSRCRKLHSIARSVVVLDEAQTMPLPLLRPCVAALKELVHNYRASVVLCTATQPALRAGSAGTETGFEGGFTQLRELVLDDVPSLFADLRRVTLRRIGVQTDADLAAHIGGVPQALCIVNQRAHARALYEAIRALPGARHLSTCMHSVHRARILAEIREDLKASRPCRVISTSLVEAGVDVDFPLVLRAEAGLDQIAQAAGRCNREFGHAPEESEVLVFKAESYDVLQSLKANAESAVEIMDCRGDDPFAPEAMRAFFNLLYWRRGAVELDRRRVLAACEEHAGDLNFPFAEIAAAMRFIDDVMVPVIVPAEDDGAVAPLLEKLRWVERPGGVARQLGRYSVGVPRRARAEMLARGVASCIRREDFGDQFVVLDSLDLYSPDQGLDWSNPTFRRVEGLIVT